MQKVSFTKTDDLAIIPKYQYLTDAGADLHAIKKIKIPPQECGLVPTGLKIQMPDNLEAQIRSRSGLAMRKNVFVLNSPGTIDPGYRGEIGVLLFNLGRKEFVIQQGDRIAQIVFNVICRPEFIITEKLEGSDRGIGGFGSTGRS